MSSRNNSYGTLGSLNVDGRAYGIHRLEELEKNGLAVSHLPYSLRLLLENLLRREDGFTVTGEQIEALVRWDPKQEPSSEIAFTPGRVLLQDFTGVPAIADLAAMRSAVKRMNGDPKRVNPLLPLDLVIDHSVQVDAHGSPFAFAQNAAKEFERNRERYAFLRWGQKAFSGFRVVPPDTGIVHQVNLEHLATVVMTRTPSGHGPTPLSAGAAAAGAAADAGKGDALLPMAYPDSVVGTDSHTTMINGLGVLGWGVGGIEAEAALLGQPISMLIPQVVGVRLVGRLAPGATSTDLVLTVTQRLRQKGVVGKFVEFFGPGLDALSLADRATIANMAPEYGATCGLFPVDDASLSYLRLTGRSDHQVALVESYMKEQGMFRDGAGEGTKYSDALEIDLASVEPSLAGPRRPQDRVRLGDVKRSFLDALDSMRAAAARSVAGASASSEANEGPAASGEPAGAGDAAQDHFTLDHGAVVIAAITSCTNTSNPSVMLAAGLLARNAVKRGLRAKPWVKSSLAPGSKAVTEYLKEARLAPYLDQIGFHLVGYGCTTCIGNSGPLPPGVSRAIKDRELVVAAVLSGNRNFEGRINPEVRANYLASPPLVVAFALAGRIDVDLESEPIGEDPDGKPVFLRDVWPTPAEVSDLVQSAVRSEMFRKSYADVTAGDEQWQGLEVGSGETYDWDPGSTYVKQPPFFHDLPAVPPPPADIQGARVLALLGDSITTDHISPAGSIAASSPAGRYLQERGVSPADFNSYGARRGNHEVMMRGTFANVRLRNLLVPGVEGGETVHLPDGARMSIFDAAGRYAEEKVPLVVLAGKEYGTGSSRDWAAKGPRLLGVRAVIAESFERIHRSNLVGMGIAPLEFRPGESVGSLKLTGRESFDIAGLAGSLKEGFRGGREVTVRARSDQGGVIEFKVRTRIDTPQESLYYRHGGILPFVLRQILSAS